MGGIFNKSKRLEDFNRITWRIGTGGWFEVKILNVYFLWKTGRLLRSWRQQTQLSYFAAHAQYCVHRSKHAYFWWELWKRTVKNLSLTCEGVFCLSAFWPLLMVIHHCLPMEGHTPGDQMDTWVLEVYLVTLFQSIVFDSLKIKSKKHLKSVSHYVLMSYCLKTFPLILFVYCLFRWSSYQGNSVNSHNGI